MVFMKKTSFLISLICFLAFVSVGCSKKSNQQETEYEESVLQDKINVGYFDKPPSQNVDLNQLDITLAVDMELKKIKPSDFPNIDLIDIKEHYYFHGLRQLEERRHVTFIFDSSNANNEYIKNVAFKLTNYKFVYDADYVTYFVSD